MNRDTADHRLQNDSGKIASSTAGQAAGGGHDCLPPCTDNAVTSEPGQSAFERPPLWRRVATRFSTLVIAACRGPLM
jgi:hypothetical protein